MNATDKQIGGTHYKTAIQPVQYIHANNLNFFEGNVVKYITRHRNKGGRADLEKAIHYIEMLIQFEYPDSTEITEKVTAGEALNPGDLVAIKNGVTIKASPIEPLIVDRFATDNNQNTYVYDSHITAKGKVWPDNPVAYITESDHGPFSCEGCIFNENAACSVTCTNLTAYCTKNEIIYKSLKNENNH